MALVKFVRDQLLTTLPYPHESAAGKTVIVTGANVGLGFETAKHFVRLGAAKVVLAVRDTEKGKAARRSIEEQEGRRGIVDVWSLDLCSYESVKHFAEKAEKSLPRLDVLLENAGVAKYTFSMAEENETSITVNVVSTFLLALLLLPKLRETAARYNVTPHLTIVSSNVHFFTQFPEKSSPNIFETLASKEGSNMVDRYNATKLLEVFYARELAARTKFHDDVSVIINFVNPGMCQSELAREASWIIIVMRALFARTTEAGSRTLVHAAQAGQETHGQYVSNCRVEMPSPLVLSEVGKETQIKVWEQLSRKLERIKPGVMGAIPGYY